MEEEEVVKENKFPEYIMKNLRERLGLEEDDTSRDEEINKYSESRAFDEVLAWEGFGSYNYWIKSRIKDIYNVEL